MIIRALSRDTRIYGELGSTNDEMNRLLGEADLEEGTVIRAGYQSEGKGYQGNKWMSEPGKNLLFSILLKPGTLPAASAFHLSRIVSLSLVDLLHSQGINALIKWPNDILTGSGKICGILIENSIISDRVSHSIVGVGLNVNQEIFDPVIPFPTSMYLEKGCHFDMNVLLDEFRKALSEWYQVLLIQNELQIMEAYLEKLFLRGKPGEFSDGKIRFRACVKNVLPGGDLELELENGDTKRFRFKEVEFFQPSS